MFHGTFAMAVGIQATCGVLIPSDDKAKGHDFHSETEKGVWANPRLGTALNYARASCMLGDGNYLRFVWELLVDDADNLIPEKRQKALGGLQ